MECDVRFFIFHFKWKMDVHFRFAMKNEINGMYMDQPAHDQWPPSAPTSIRAATPRMASRRSITRTQLASTPLRCHSTYGLQIGTTQTWLTARLVSISKCQIWISISNNATLAQSWLQLSENGCQTHQMAFTKCSDAVHSSKTNRITPKSSFHITSSIYKHLSREVRACITIMLQIHL
jgi:hypothetical protein